MANYYILDGQTAVPVDDALEWATWNEAQRESLANGGPWANRVAETYINECRISTVFLGVNYSFMPDTPPLIFETMVFPDDDGGESHCERYSTWAEAEEGHARIVAAVEAGEIPD